MSVKQVIVVRKDLKMRKGKLAGQVAHACMGFIHHIAVQMEGVLEVPMSPTEFKWFNDDKSTKIVCGVDSKEELEDLMEKAGLLQINYYPMVDLGLTEFNGVKTLTCAAFGPDEAEILDPLTGHLKPL